MKSKSSLPSFIYFWYCGLNVWQKIFYPILAVVLYGLSVIFVVAGYWAKTDMGYDLFSRGGWHAFSQCIAREIVKE